MSKIRTAIAMAVLMVSYGLAQTPPDAPRPDAKQSPKPDGKANPPNKTEKAAKPEQPKDNKKGDQDPASDSGKPPDDPNALPEFTVGPGDIMNINVWKEPEVSGQVQVRGDCRITLALVKDEKVCGMTPSQIQALLAERLGKFIAAPDVTVTLHQMNSRKVSFIGNVKRPGTMLLLGPMTVAQAINDAGGLAEFANDKKIVIQREESGKTERFEFNYREYLKGKSTKGNIWLKPNDIVIVK